ncbi:MAG: glutamate--tRNA ligase, partial [Calditrichaeota bacterium]
DRSKLSKRQGDVAVEDFLEKGYLPEALNNFVALLGWNPGTDQEIFSIDELITTFSLERVHKSGAVFDLPKLNWMNRLYIRQLSPARRNSYIGSFLDKAGFDTSDPIKNQKVVEAIYQRISNGTDVKQEASIFYLDKLEIREPEAREILKKSSARRVLETFLSKTDEVDDLNINTFQNVMKEIQAETGIRKQELWMPVRVALTGVTHGPDLPLVIDILDRNKIRSFINQALTSVS